MDFGNPHPGPLLPCTRGSPASEAASHDSYCLVVGDATGVGVFVVMGMGVAVGTGTDVFVAVGMGTGVAVGGATGVGVFVVMRTGTGVAVEMGVGVAEGSSSSSHTTPSWSPSRADGTMDPGNPHPGPLLPCTRGSPATTAASHDSYCLVVGDATGMGVFVAVGSEVAMGVGVFVAVGTGTGVAVGVGVGVAEGSSSSSHTMSSPSPSRADGTMDFGNPHPGPLLPCTRGSSAATAASHDSYCLVVGDATGVGVFVVMGMGVDLGMSIVVGTGTAVDCGGG